MSNNQEYLFIGGNLDGRRILVTNPAAIVQSPRKPVSSPVFTSDGVWPPRFADFDSYIPIRLGEREEIIVFACNTRDPDDVLARLVERYVGAT